MSEIRRRGDAGMCRDGIRNRSRGTAGSGAPKYDVLWRQIAHAPLRLIDIIHRTAARPFKQAHDGCLFGTIGGATEGLHTHKHPETDEYRKDRYDDKQLDEGEPAPFRQVSHGGFA